MQPDPGSPQRDTREVVLIAVAASAATAVLAVEALGVAGLIRPVTLMGAGGLAVAVLVGMMRSISISVTESNPSTGKAGATSDISSTGLTGPVFSNNRVTSGLE